MIHNDRLSVLATSFAIGKNKTGITVAGITGSSGAAANQLAIPYCVAVGSSNTIYVSDQSNQRVQKWMINASSGSTAAGQSNTATGAALNYLSYPSDLAVDENGSLYVVDGGNHHVVYWPNGASSGTLVAGTGKESSGNNLFLKIQWYI